jgi:hypothetical protein
MALKFVSYDGRYPSLCSGKLVLDLDGRRVEFPNHCLVSGGSVYQDDDGGYTTSEGEWSISEWPEGFPEDLKTRACELVNENVMHGRCGGCI